MFLQIKYISINKIMSAKINFIITNISILLFFAVVYFSLPENSFSKEGKLSLMDSIYFSVISHTTVGYGDIYPTTNTSKFFVLCHICLVFSLIAGFS